MSVSPNQRLSRHRPGFVRSHRRQRCLAPGQPSRQALPQHAPNQAPLAKGFKNVICSERDSSSLLSVFLPMPISPHPKAK